MADVQTLTVNPARGDPDRSERGGSPENWVKAAALAELRDRRVMTVKLGAKQIALFYSDSGVYACNNRCPHEGYPLKEGHLTEGCILTCNWHNWKFDLESGETLIGGDQLRRYPVELRGGEVWLDITDPPAEERIAASLAAVRDALRNIDRRAEYDRVAREISRLQLAGGDPLEAVRATFRWTHDCFEFGTTHAQAVAPDWLELRDSLARDRASKLVPLVEIIAHLGEDCLREPRYPFPTGEVSYDPDLGAAALVAAIEAEDEAAAIALLRGALNAGLGFAELERPLVTAALAHYADFGHSLIYVYKTGQLIEKLGTEVTEPLLLTLVRSLVYATREDLIPEFRAYAPALAAWDGSGAAEPKVEDFTRLSVRKAMRRVLKSSARPEALFDALLGAAAWQMLHFDTRMDRRSDNPVSRNVSWLDFSHALTFANAVRATCRRYPELWPRGLLQLACFTGRNVAFVDAEQGLDDWRVADPTTFLDDAL